jgi:hypothetical protein
MGFPFGMKSYPCQFGCSLVGNTQWIRCAAGYLAEEIVKKAKKGIKQAA